MANTSTTSETMPTACEGKKRWNGNKNPVTLVATVVQIKTAVQPLNCFEASRPNSTTNPAKMPIKLSDTCTNVKYVIPKIMRAPSTRRSARVAKGDRYHTRDLRSVQSALVAEQILRASGLVQPNKPQAAKRSRPKNWYAPPKCRLARFLRESREPALLTIHFHLVFGLDFEPALGFLGH